MIVMQYDPTAYFTGQPSSAVDAVAMVGSNGASEGTPEVVIQNNTTGTAARVTWDNSTTDGGMNSGLVAVKLDANLRTGVDTWSVADASSDPVTLDGTSGATINRIELFAGAQNYAGQVLWSDVQVQYLANGVVQETGTLPSSLSVDATTSVTGIQEQCAQITPAASNDDEVIVTGNIKLTSPSGTYPAPDDLFTQALVVANAPAPTLVSSAVGDGTDQRSVVSSLSVTFNEPVNFSSSSFSLFQQALNDDGSINTSGTPTDVSSSVTASNPSSDGLTWVLSVSGGASLSNGIYQLVLHGATITDAATSTGSFNGGSDQIVSFDSVEAGGASNYFHVLYGDINGDGSVDLTDYRAFRNAYGSDLGDSNYLAGFDFNQDGTIDLTDYSAFQDTLLMCYSY